MHHEQDIKIQKRQPCEKRKYTYVPCENTDIVREPGPDVLNEEIVIA
jgi:hypothetical protein